MTPNRAVRAVALAALAVMPIGVVGCGSARPGGSAVPAVTHAADMSATPAIRATGRHAVTTLLIRNLVTGSGPVAKATDTVTVHYVGALYPSGKVFNAWNGPISFPLQHVIPGFERGIVGMRVGGRRELVIPPKLAYGSASPGAGIPPDATLTFVIDLGAVSPGG